MNLSGTNVAIYCRLSREDGNEESQSIQSQKEILTKYVNEQDWNIIDYYIDDGYSGTNFDRPSFQRLLNDIEVGRINIVITKDLSRLGRNYIQTGYYTEEYFPSHNIRYIALNDNFDTLKDENNDFVPFKNIINEWYAKDISKKIRFTLDNKAKNGEPRNTVFPIFGYAYNENFERIPDPETAPIVQFIFKEYAKAGSSVKVARLLTSNKVKLPCYYNAVKYNYNKEKVLSKSEEELYTWEPNNVRDILEKNDYIGTYTTSRSKSQNYKNKKRYDNQDCYVFENRYEPLIDRETFETVQKILHRTRSGTITREENSYKGLVICADCGKPLKFERKRNRNTGEFDSYRYFCNNKSCSSFNHIHKKILNLIVKQELSTLRDVILKQEEGFVDFAEKADSKGRNLNTDVSQDIKAYLKKNAEIDNFIQTLFEQNARGIIPQSTFEVMMTKYSKEKKFVEDQIKDLTKLEQQQLSKSTNEQNANKFVTLLKSIDENQFLDPDVMSQFIYVIKIKAIRLSQRKFNYDVTINYGVVDNLIKEFRTYEENSSNIR